MYYRLKNRCTYIVRMLVFTAMLLLTAAICCTTVYAEQEETKAGNIIGKCTVKASSGNDKIGLLYDGSTKRTFRTSGEGEQFISVALDGSSAQGVYLKWGLKTVPWTLEATLSDGTVVTGQHGQYGLFQEYVELPADTAAFRIITDDGKARPLSLVELSVYSQGKLPSAVHIWEPTPTKAEIMFVSTHQDDELLYFGGSIPYYAGELDYDTVVVYTAYTDDIRIHEALEGLWVCGCSQNPIFFGYPDKKCYSIETARLYWDQNELIKNLTRMLVTYQPQVVVTQDINGEYGHGQHLITVYGVRKALEKAQDTEYVYSNFQGVDPWTVSKCYIHLYKENRITMPWGDLKMASAGGKSTLEVARDAYQQHKSQHKFGYKVGTTPATYDCRQFGLYWTQVGKDVQKNDFFENITLRAQHVDPGENVPTCLKRVGSTGWLYLCDAEGWTGSRWLRHCSVNGETGWYAADHTGTLTEPMQPILLVVDDFTLDISSYETLTCVSTSPTVYRYFDGTSGVGFTVRFCSVEGRESAFYLSDEDGELIQPLTKLEPEREIVVEEMIAQTPILPEEPEPMDSTHIVIIVMALLLAAVAIILSAAVISLMKKNKNRRSVSSWRRGNGR